MSAQLPEAANDFLTDLSRFQTIAKTHAQNRPKAGAAAEAQTSIALMQTLLAAEIVCILRYTAISVSTAGLQHVHIGKEFQEQANDERRHMMILAQRILELGGTPNFDPDNLLCRTSFPLEDDLSFSNTIEQSLEAERIVIDHYQHSIDYFSGTDPLTCSILCSMLQDEKDHRADLIDLLHSNSI